MHKLIYRRIRDLHLYLGLSLCPFVLVFAVSTIALNHPSHAPADPGSAATTVSGLRIPDGLEKLAGMDRVRGIQPVLRQAGVSGEVEWVTYLPAQARMIIPVARPGRTATVELYLKTGAAKIRRSESGLLGALVYLHKSPGPHLHDIRGNWVYTRVWKVFADGTVYVLLFLAGSGVYLWALLRRERRTGLTLLGVGFALFALLVYGLAS